MHEWEIIAGIITTMTQKQTDNESTAIMTGDFLASKIYTVRGQKVMLDFELAKIYYYETKNFNRQVKNNAEKFVLVMAFKIMKDTLMLRQQPMPVAAAQIFRLSHRFDRVEDQLKQTVTKSELGDFITHFTEQNFTNEYIFYQGQIVEAYTVYQKIFSNAQSCIHIVG